ncbi:MAG: efflux RND transporter periplasmic adaptor subunit [Pseudomonadota bacterium]
MLKSRSLGVVIIAGLALWGCGPSEETGKAAETAPATPVMAATARPAPSARDVSAYGVVRTDKEGKLAFKIGGFLKEIRVDMGDRVTKGEVLARLDQREIDAEAARASAAAAKAKRDLTRIEPLLKNGYVSRQRVDDAKSALTMANAELANVTFNRSLATIIAPSDGVILTRHVDQNEIVAAGTPVLTVSQGAGELILKASLSDRDVAALNIGDKADVTLDAFRGARIAGHVRRISAMSDERTGTFDVEIVLDNAPAGTESGFIGMARIRSSETGNAPVALAIPASAILEGHGASATVYVIDKPSMTVKLTRVGIAGLEGDDVLISSGLKTGDDVVSAGAPYLREGSPVKVVTDLAAETEAAEPRT